mmetsp:Transcript_121907/g.306776  ORF Transcript_121907/g.306776 Transcript_121907/m.306776 type:complete len:333 (+) Transcript_121907:414-1412(+)
MTSRGTRWWIRRYLWWQRRPTARWKALGCCLPLTTWAGSCPSFPRCPGFGPSAPPCATTGATPSSCLRSATRFCLAWPRRGPTRVWWPCPRSLSPTPRSMSRSHLGTGLETGSTRTTRPSGCTSRVVTRPLSTPTGRMSIRCPTCGRSSLLESTRGPPSTLTCSSWSGSTTSLCPCVRSCCPASGGWRASPISEPSGVSPCWSACQASPGRAARSSCGARRSRRALASGGTRSTGRPAFSCAGTSLFTVLPLRSSTPNLFGGTVGGRSAVERMYAAWKAMTSSLAMPISFAAPAVDRACGSTAMGTRPRGWSAQSRSTSARPWTAPSRTLTS